MSEQAKHTPVMPIDTETVEWAAAMCAGVNHAHRCANPAHPFWNKCYCENDFGRISRKGRLEGAAPVRLNAGFYF